ncbi:hypothetical protein YQE_04979, partial [Dendroctonus ponderosae]
LGPANRLRLDSVLVGYSWVCTRSGSNKFRDYHLGVRNFREIARSVWTSQCWQRTLCCHLRTCFRQDFG